MKVRDLLTAILCVFGWAANIAFIKYATQYTTLFSFAVLRFSLPLFFIGFVLRPPRVWRQLLLATFFLNGISYSLMSYSVFSGTPLALSAVLFQTYIFFAVFFGKLLMNEKPSRQAIVGMIISMLGASGLMLHKTSFEGINMIGLLAALGSAVAFGFGQAYIRASALVFDFRQTIWMAMMTVPFMVIFGTFFEGGDVLLYSLCSLPAHVVRIAFASSFGVTILAAYLWMGLVKRHSAATLGGAPFLMAFFSALIGFWVFHEQYGVSDILWSTLILCGLLMGNMTKLPFPKLFSGKRTLSAALSSGPPQSK
jgi:O-acetylserine/cysteine efflux transporter